MKKRVEKNVGKYYDRYSHSSALIYNCHGQSDK